MRRLLLLLMLLWPSLVMAQSQFGNQMVQSGSTCPPVTQPLSGTGTLYTCTGTGALYTWTGSAWVGVVGGGGGAETVIQSAIPDVDSSLYDAPSLAGAGAGNVSNGTHRYKFTYGDQSGAIQTADSGAPTAAVTVVDNSVNGQVTVNVPGLCDAIYPVVYVYRDKNSDGIYKLVGDLNQTCEKTLLDNIADGSLGATIPTTNNTLAPILSFADGNVVIPSRADSSGNQDLFFSAISTGGSGPYIAFKPEDRLTSATPIKGMIFWGGYNLIPASVDYAEGGQIGAQGGQDTGGGYAFVTGGATYSNNSLDFQGGSFLIIGGGTATSGGAFSLNSGSSFAAGNINGGNGEILGGVFANGGHYGDLTFNQWRNVSITGTGSLTLTTIVAPAASGTRFLCISTTGVVTSSASACSGT